ncbi:MAG: hypothetical protein AAF629_27540 [Chloroflexota bacterium]
MEEYYYIADTVLEFDKRLLVIKGWGVTLGLAALAWGFQNQHYGLFLIASISGAAFWIIEASVKRHQMRFYSRQREIEVICFALFNFDLPDKTKSSTPQIFWGWSNAPAYFAGAAKDASSPPKQYGNNIAYWMAGFFPHVAFPHVITVIFGMMLFVLGVIGWLNMPL